MNGEQKQGEFWFDSQRVGALKKKHYNGKTRSTDEAMKLLRKRRLEQIMKARELAVEICERVGSVSSREVRKAMAAAGELDNDEHEFWLGAVFRHERFQWTGRYYTYRDSARNIHERTVKVWELRA